MWPRFAASLLVGFGACFAPVPPTGVPCGTALQCPAGQFCVQHDGIETCETSDPGPGDDDRDDDGVRDRDDNCPDLANADQADEEGDGLGDGCDPCPPFDSNSDADDDGVGDACDPNPETSGDRLVAFEGFARPLPSTWQVSGDFVVEDGEAIATSREAESALATIASPASPRIEIRATATFTAITATGTNLGSVNLVERLATNTEKAIACQLSGLASGMQQQLRIFDLDAGTVIDTAPHAFGPSAEIDLRLRRSGTMYSCRVTDPALELAGTAMLSPASPRIGLRVRGANASFHWVMIVTSP